MRAGPIAIGMRVMLAYFLRRARLTVPTFLALMFLTFVAIRLVPGDPVEVRVGEHGISPERLALFRHELGLDQPVWKQFLDYAWRLLHGDFGVSLATQQKVLTEFLTLFPATLELSFFAMMFAVAVGVPAGAVAAVKRGGVFDQALMTISLFGYSMPIFWWGLLLIMFVSVKLGLLPVSGRIDLINYDFDQPTGFMTIDALLSGQPGAFLDALRHLVLPAIVLGTVPLGVIARMTRSSMLEVLSEDYVRTARAKGLSPRRVIGVHALAQRAPAGGHGDRPFGLGPDGRRRADGDDLLLARRRQMADRIDRPARLSGAAGRRDAGLRRRHPRQPDRRSHLRRDRSADPPWPLTSLPANAPLPADDSDRRRSRQPWPPAAFWAAFRENKGAVFGLAVFGLVVLLALAADLVAPHSPIEQFRDAVRAPPVWEAGGSWRFILGTDGDGHDMLSRLIFGARVSLFIGFSVMSVSFVIGAVLGLIAAMTGPIVDVAITRLMDLIMAVPSLVLAILVVAVLGPSLANTIVAVTIVYLPGYVRLVRASAWASSTRTT